VKSHPAGAAYIGSGFESWQGPAGHGGDRGLPKVSFGPPGGATITLRLGLHSYAKGIVGN
jgi:hypothetical protein